MKFKVFILFFLSSWHFTSSAEVLMTKYSLKTKKYDTIKVANFDGVEVTADCISKKQKNCLAIDAVKKPTKTTSSTSELLGHPAARYCHALGAENIILLDKKKNEFDYCSFNDGSVAEAWALYNRHHK